MALRAVLLVTLSVLAASALAGCQDRLRGTGTLEVLLKPSETASVVVGGKTYHNRIANFSKAEMPILVVSFKRSAEQPVIPPENLNRAYDLAAGRGTEIKLFDRKVLEGDVLSVSFLVLPFNGTLTSGAKALVNTSAPFTYEVKKNATIEVTQTTSFVASFLVSDGPTRSGGREYFLMVLPAESGPR